MTQKCVLADHESNINAVIKAPLKFTQRIKFTCFDVSHNYVVFGATSGGLYVFSRYPPVFLKLIPSKYGAVAQVAVSQNERAVVLGSFKGLVVVIENCFNQSNIQYQVYSEHEGNEVTALKWHMEDVYCGDSKGMVSVIMLPNLLTKAIFQTPCASLMKLDSAIVQIDCYSKYLLISTYTRTYLCDTDKEQYRQIGKKLRDGQYGGCFFSRCDGSNETAAVHLSTSGSLFTNMKDDEQFLPATNEDVRIFCARPGARMWEAKLDASVTRTHQFKNFLRREPNSIVRLNDSSDLHLQISDFSASSISTNEQKLFNFTKVFLLGNDFVFTFNKDGFYVFNPETLHLVCWCRKFKHIRDVKVIKHFIYIWNEQGEMHVMALYSLERIILKTLFNKQYYLCGELCINYMDDILAMLESSEKIHLILVLKEKLTELQASHLLEKMLPLLKAVQKYSNQKCCIPKIPAGVVVVNNLHLNETLMFSENEYKKEQQLPETLQTLKDFGTNVTDKLTESTKSLKEKLQVLETTVKNLTSDDVSTLNVNQMQKNTTGVYDDSEYNKQNEGLEFVVERRIEPSSVEPVIDLDSNIKIFLQQYEVSKMNYNIEIPKFNSILQSNCLNKVVELFQDFKQYMVEKDVNEPTMKRWCYKYYLGHLEKIDFENKIEALEVGDVLKYSLEAFCEINLSSQHSCSCLFPLPPARVNSPNHYKVGCVILNNLKSRNLELFNKCHLKVPYMWKFIIEQWKGNESMDILLPLLMQFGDELLIVKYLSRFKYDTWDNAMQLVIKLKRNVCVNCENHFPKNCDVISWEKFAMLVVRSIGGPSTLNLLTRYCSYIPSSELSSDFYQSCIFVSAVDNSQEKLRNEAAAFVETTLQSDAASAELNNLMITFLKQKHMKKPSKCPKTSLTYSEKSNSRCCFCDLPVDVPILNGDIKLKCQHSCHEICFKYNKNVCKICNK